MYSEENAVKIRSFRSFSFRLRLRRFSDGINREIDAMKILTIANTRLLAPLTRRL
jgi:hypothetical protein